MAKIVDGAAQTVFIDTDRDVFAWNPELTERSAVERGRQRVGDRVAQNGESQGRTPSSRACATFALCSSSVSEKPWLPSVSTKT